MSGLLKITAVSGPFTRNYQLTEYVELIIDFVVRA